MQTKKRIFLGFLRFSSFIVISFYLLAAGCSDYKFGVYETDYPELFSGPPYLNNVMKYNKDYSWHTRVPVGDSRMKIEHGVLASLEDKRRLGINSDERLIFASIEFNDMPAFELKWVHSSGGAPLEIKGTYIFSAPMTEDCTSKKNWENWIVERVDSSFIDRSCPFGLVRVYRLPEYAFIMRYLPQWLWLSQLLDEELEIKVDDNSVNYSFQIRWHKTATPLWRISTIT